MNISKGHINSGQDQTVQSKADKQADVNTILQAYKKPVQFSGNVIQRRVITRSLSRIFAETQLKTQEDFNSLIIFLKKSGFEEHEFNGIVSRILDGEFKSSEEKVDDADEEGINEADHQGLENHEDEKANDKYISDNNITQFARKPNVVSGPKSYGSYVNVAYKTDDKGCIDFSTTHGAPTAWSDPVDPGTEVELTKAVKASNIDKKNRAQHFAIGDHLLAKTKFGANAKASQITNYRKSKWTWHHLKDPYKMVLVDMLVHAKHGHNGGVHIW